MNKLLLILFFTAKHLMSFSQTYSIYDSDVKKGDVLITQKIIFELDKYEIDSNFFLDSLVDFYKQKDSLIIEVGCHFDERYPKGISKKLSYLRAKAIVDYLITKGINSKRLIAVGYNATKPKIKDAKTEIEHQINRRIEFLILETNFKE